MQDFKKLDVWKRAHDLAVHLYHATNGAPHARDAALIAHMRTAARAIPVAVARGCGQGSQREFARFLELAVSSANELEYQLLLSHDLGILASAAFARLDARTTQSRQMLIALLRRVRQAAKPPPAGAAAAATPLRPSR